MLLNLIPCCVKLVRWPSRIYAKLIAAKLTIQSLWSCTKAIYNPDSAPILTNTSPVSPESYYIEMENNPLIRSMLEKPHFSITHSVMYTSKIKMDLRQAKKVV